MPRKRRPPASPRAPLPWDELFPSLDLHGETAESALRIAERWLREQQADGVRTVRVITGRGRRSLGPPVLRGEIGDLLARLKGSVVARSTPEAAGGAFRVELRKPARPRSPAAPRSRAPTPLPAARDPALRRRAEESLADLGIDPTPVLVEAEMRRILKEEGGEE